MEEEIRKIIDSQLPAQVGEVLRRRLEQADKDAAEVERLTKMVGDQKTLIRVRDECIEKQNAQLSAHGVLADRELAVEKRERAIELEIAKCRADNAERSKGDLFNLVGLVFKNPVFKETISKSANIQNGMGGTSFSSESSTATREVE